MQELTAGSIPDPKVRTQTTSRDVHQTHKKILSRIAVNSKFPIATIPHRHERLNSHLSLCLSGRFVDLLEALDGIQHRLHPADVHHRIHHLRQFELSDLQS